MVDKGYGYYWPSILKDCIKYAKGCQPCQKHGNIQRILADELHNIVEAVPLKKAEQGDAINFVKENITHRFGIPESLTMDQGTMFTGSDMREFAADYGIKLINSPPHYPQSSIQAEASNKVLIKILQKMMEENPRDWPRLLSETLWAYRTSKRTAETYTVYDNKYEEIGLPMDPHIRAFLANGLGTGRIPDSRIRIYT
ncbi:uncharacterized protein [Primulina huaijiensis]|uniref:uncharacterized protein n=1 Tax=Primulina huaijiensis TaxID=1492673 RepID=UPI003CC703D3